MNDLHTSPVAKIQAGRLFLTIATPLRKDLKAIILRLDKLSREADAAAVATEL